MVTVRNNLNTLKKKSETHTSKDKYENSVRIEAAAADIPTKLTAKYRVP